MRPEAIENFLKKIWVFAKIRFSYDISKKLLSMEEKEFKKLLKLI